MCELLGMSANVPTDLRFSLIGLTRRGGETGPHGDGWGVAFHPGGRDCQVFREAAAGARSALAGFLSEHPVPARIAVAHVRRANRGRLGVENTHPFVRELWGRSWSFAHNGQLKGVKRLRLGLYRPVGTTDSEHAFCWLLGRLRAHWSRSPAEATLVRALTELCCELEALGRFNVLLGDGTRLFAWCSTQLVMLTRRAPFGRATLADADLTVDFARETGPKDVVTIVATRPLTTDESWTALPPSSLTVLREGERVVHEPAPAPVRRPARYVPRRHAGDDIQRLRAAA
jgi:glutamine amidotransferase